MIKELVENYVKACDELADIAGVILFPERLHCQLDKLIEFAEKQGVNLEVKETPDNKYYDYEISATVDGYRFHAIATEEEYRTYMKGRVA